MSKIIVRGGRKLSGKVKVNGAKNAVLPIIAASLLASEGESVIQDAPPLDDVLVINKVLESLGAKLEYTNNAIRICANSIQTCEASYELVRKMRASFLVMGPLLARLGEARISLPGGCAIGTRPIDQHLKGFEAMGAEIELGQGYIEARVKGRLKGTKIYLDVASVGATENIIMAAVLAEGTTILENAAKEPEIVDLANYLNAMGAVVRGAGTGMIRIEGVEKLRGAVHTVIPDRIEAGTYMIAAAITKSDLYVEGAIGDHLRPVISKLQEMGVTLEEDENGIRVIGTDKPLKAVDVKTLPYPGFPTDMQSQMMALLMVADGTSLVSETVFENRFMHVDEFINMNAEIKVDGRTAIVTGNTKLKGAKVCATDLRAGAALILAGLVAEGETEITGLHHIDRGYVDIAATLNSVGADIQRVSDQELKAVEPDMGMLAVQPTWA
ncbi:UDP-N-acetylglucosamine 1-carboxyvinyltransferase [Paenibacillus larvae]|uniref:UDP-N-acetylglucosamine 1-carboxyvinyltransferase n=1 Tax=Paenibacillus larvae TaxID=1464 RepID=A0AAP5N2Z0_9BACL|nr:UDP-N-acetylglucosamine 1-carboxyvinyltransferase [Paenibacillus larvae]AQR78651.1 UDP-N-acetylglucosamine 1-carboxyvinyltransferase [Paenibacillus larvae subsp. larvae]AVF20087.1 UDP-N-acetylglucosamine 1-carboxyvinyltransferase [Paenibacillus larvae subsp. larvae]ETK29177.1 UDP-N-acetylglucosamine 1-carboxyvinyltransferase [Paenibacillus larvae subsp. larvae DSM 25719]MCY7475685.1 UDP-N-acetylglucosamine 1-carboxyvinyltransferase [Paenibacillus larvae]MCY7489211.1 UDP-N-acetylglucosamine 